jgi:hypothetical protein
MNKTLKDLLSKNTPQKSGDWAIYLNAALFVTRTTKQGSTRHTPAELLYGREMCQPFETQDESHEARICEDFLLDEITRLKEICQDAHLFIKKAQERQKQKHDMSKHLLNPILIGTKVLLYHNLTESSWSAKLKPKWEGPFLIQDKKDTTYHLRTLSGTILPKTFNRNRLKIYNERPPSQHSGRPYVEIPSRSSHPGLPKE